MKVNLFPVEEEGGTLKRRVTSQSVYPLSEQDALEAQERRYTAYGKERHWEQLEDWVRGQVQRLIQELLEEEMTEFLGRAKSARRSDSDSDTGCRNGYSRPRS